MSEGEVAEVHTSKSTVLWDVHLEESDPLDDAKEHLCSKKRVRNPEGWKRVRQKKARIAGKEYLNVRGNFVPARKIGPDCNCKLMCYKHVDETMRNMIFDGFYDLSSYDEQNAYLFGLIRKHDIKRKTNPNSARRTCTYKYHLRFRGREINVCKVAFARIHAISAKKIRGLCEKLDQNILFPKDNRGKHTNRPQKIQPETQELIKRHLYLVLRSPDVRDYFKEDKNHPSSTELNITKLYKHFLLTYDPNALLPGSTVMNPAYMPRVKMWLYRSVFHQEFRTKEYQALKKKLEQGYRSHNELEDYNLQDKVFTSKRGKRKGTRPQKKQVHYDENEITGVQTVVQRLPRAEAQGTALITVPMDVSFATAYDGRTAEIINRGTVQQVIMEHRSPTMLQLNRTQGMNQTLSLQKINYTIDPQGEHVSQNYQIFHTDGTAYHQNMLTGTEPIYHLDKGGGELIPLRPIRISTGAGEHIGMQIPTGY